MPRPRPRYMPKLRAEETIPTTSTPIKISPRTPISSQPSKSAKKVLRTALKPEVVISVSRVGSYKGKMLARPDIHSEPPMRQLDVGRGNSPKWHTGGKDKGITCSLRQQQQPSIPPTLQQEQSTPRDVSHDSSSPQPAPSRGRKRRRVSSTSSSDALPQQRSFSQPSPRNPRGLGRSSGCSSDTGPPTSSPVQTDYPDDTPSARSDSSHYQAISEAPLPPLPAYHPFYSQMTRNNYHTASSGPIRSHTPRPIHPPHSTYSEMSMHQSEAMAWASYLIATGTLIPSPPYPPGSGYRPGPPLPFYGLPQTPSHRGHSSYPSHNPHTPSSSGAMSSRSYTHSSPTHHPPSYPYWPNPAYSSGTLPPSSPLPSSSIYSSPILRPASVPPGQRSRSRGRRVSFKLDANDRPLSQTPPRHPPSSDPIGSDLESDGDRGLPTRGRAGRSSTPANPTRGKGKGKARAASPDDEDRGDVTAESAGHSRGRPSPRARTPGPPLRRAQSLPRGAAGIVTGSSANKGAKSTAKKK
ncbi:hypothetical protein BC628DRAFT_1497208 [Trametes gibbosa]|nr:hypothetical protein BC628DRAFT_1497208 [Trametes gibbosa]